eukprot:gene111-161_t
MSVELSIDTVNRQAVDQTFDCAKHAISSEMGEFEYYVDANDLSVKHGVLVPATVRYRMMINTTQESDSIASKTARETVYKFKEVVYRDRSPLHSETKVYQKVVIKYTTDSPSFNGFSDIILKCVFDQRFDDNSPSTDFHSAPITDMMRAVSLAQKRSTEGRIGWCDRERLCNSVMTPYKIAKVLNSEETSHSHFVGSFKLWYRKQFHFASNSVDRKDIRSGNFLLTVAVMPAFVTTLDLFIPNKNADTVTEELWNRGRSSKLTTQVYTWIASKVVRMLICLTEQNMCYPDLKPANIALWSDINEDMQLTFIDLDSLDHFEGQNGSATYPHPEINPEYNGLFTSEPKYMWWSFMCLLADVDRGYDACDFYWRKAAQRREEMVVPPYSLERFYTSEEGLLREHLHEVFGNDLEKCLWDTYLKFKTVNTIIELPTPRPTSLQQPNRVHDTIRILKEFLEQVKPLSLDRVRPKCGPRRDTKLLRLGGWINAFILEIYNEPPIDDTVKPIQTHVLDKMDTLYCVGKERVVDHDRIPKSAWWYPHHIKKEHIFIRNSEDYKYSLANDRPTFQLFISSNCEFLSFENCRIRGTYDGLHVIKRYTIEELSSMDTSKLDVQGEGDDDVNFRTSAVLSENGDQTENYTSGDRLDKLYTTESGEHFYAEGNKGGRLVAPGYVYRSMFIPNSRKPYNYKYFDIAPPENADVTEKRANSLYLMFKPTNESRVVYIADWSRQAL